MVDSVHAAHRWSRTCQALLKGYQGALKGTNLPDLLFLVFLETARKTTKKARIFCRCRIPKILGKEEKNAQKQGIPWKGEKQGNPKKQGKED